MSVEKELGKFGGMVGRIGGQVVTDFVKIEALKELLIEKGVLTKEEIEDKFNVLWEEKRHLVYEHIEGKDEE